MVALLGRAHAVTEVAGLRTYGQMKLESSTNSLVTVSIVSHGHGAMVWSLVDQLLALPLIGRIIVTLNITESVPVRIPENVQLIFNASPLGFGANHNQAFSQCRSAYFCVLNPDIRLASDPFSSLLEMLNDERVGVVGPRVVSACGASEDSLRLFPTPVQLLKRYLSDVHKEPFFKQGSCVFPDWIAGMFMLFRADVYRAIGGFDTDYFMYCEDADICTRLWAASKMVVAQTSVSVIHDARRSSRISVRHFVWHMTSLVRYWTKFLCRLPLTVN